MSTEATEQKAEADPSVVAASAESAPDYESMPFLKREARIIHEPLPHEEMVSKGHDLGRLRRKIQSREIALKEYQKAEKAEITKLETERDALIDVIDRGSETHVDCEVRIDESAGERVVIRCDTRELVMREKLSDKDRQPDLFPATLEDGSPLPQSRRDRQSFVEALEGDGGELVCKIHNRGLLDPPKSMLEEARNHIREHCQDSTIAFLRGEAESVLDEREGDLANHIDELDLGLDAIVEMAIALRMAGSIQREPDDPNYDAEETIFDILNARAEIDICAELEAAEAGPEASEAVETAADESVSVPRSRAFRTIDKAERVGRWDSKVYWEAHEAGLFDPTAEDRELATGDIGEKGASSHVVERINSELDALEQDLAAMISANSKARIALSRGTFPTGIVEADVAIGDIRYQRAALEVALASDPGDEPKPARRRKSKAAKTDE